MDGFPTRGQNPCRCGEASDIRKRRTDSHHSHDRSHHFSSLLQRGIENHHCTFKSVHLDLKHWPSTRPRSGLNFSHKFNKTTIIAYFGDFSAQHFSRCRQKSFAPGKNFCLNDSGIEFPRISDARQFDLIPYRQLLSPILQGHVNSHIPLLQEKGCGAGIRISYHAADPYRHLPIGLGKGNLLDLANGIQRRRCSKSIAKARQHQQHQKHQAASQPQLTR